VCWREQGFVFLTLFNLADLLCALAGARVSTPVRAMAAAPWSAKQIRESGHRSQQFYLIYLFYFLLLVPEEKF
jgi:hypothetical protein